MPTLINHIVSGHVDMLLFITLAADQMKCVLVCSCSTVGVALGALTIWHGVLISRGETSIERHINIKETKRLAKWGRVSIFCD